MKLQRYSDFVNESVRDKMTPKSKEDLKIEVDKLPAYKKNHFIEKYDLEDLYTEEELKKFRKEAPKAKKIGSWYRVEKEGENYDVLIQGKALDTIIVLEADGIFNIDKRDYMKIVSYDEWDDFEEIMEDNI